MVFRAKIQVTLRKSILDPQGKAVEHAIVSLGEGAFRNVRIGKYVELHVEGSSMEDARAMTDRVCKKLLANPVMEDYHVEIEPVEIGEASNG